MEHFVFKIEVLCDKQATAKSNSKLFVVIIYHVGFVFKLRVLWVGPDRRPHKCNKYIF